MPELELMPREEIMEESCEQEMVPTDMRTEQPGMRKMTKSELLREYEVKFNFLSSGCIIKIGCRTIAFTTVKEAMTAFNDYVNNPDIAREKWFKKFDEE